MGLSELEFTEKIAEVNEHKRLQKIAADQRQLENEKAEKEFQKDLTEKENQLLRLRHGSIVEGFVGVKAQAAFSKKGKAAAFKFIRITKNGNFGRVFYEYQFTKDLDGIKPENWKAYPKQIPKTDLHGFRSIDL